MKAADSLLVRLLCLALAGCTSAPEAARPDGGAGGRAGPGAGGGSGRDGAAGHVGLHDAPVFPEAGVFEDAEPEEDARPDVAPASAEAVAIAGGLHGAFLRLDCASEEFELQYCFPEMMGKKRVPLTFGGQFGKRYSVSLRVWGVMEAITYRDGMQSGKHFYIGGRVGTPMTAEYALEVQGAAPQKYYFNHRDIGAGEHYTYGFTYITSDIIIPGGASLVLYVSDPDNYINTNHMESAVEDITPGLQSKLDVIHAQPLQGQFIYLEVATATALP